MYKHDPRFALSSNLIKSAGPLPSKVAGALDSTKLDEVNPKFSVVPSNEALVALANALKEEVLLLGEYMSSLSVWIQLNVPRISDNSSFSAEVQMQLLEQGE